MDISDVGVLTMESACSLFLAVLAYKLYRMRISTHSGCCGDRVTIDTHNQGHDEPQSAMTQV